MAESKSGRVRTARCGCGALCVTASGEPLHVYACSCLTCRARTGSAFSYAAIFPAGAVTVTGDYRTWNTRADSGNALANHFCPACGATVFFETEGLPDRIGVAAGCFPEQDFAAPTKLYWASRRHRWLVMPQDTQPEDTQ